MGLLRLRWSRNRDIVIMKYFDTPAGKFRILLNGEPTEFDVFYGKPVTFRTRNNDEIISTNSFVASISIANLAIYDVVSGVMEKPILYYSGCIAGMDSMMCHLPGCTFELSTPYTEDHEEEGTPRFLPYESFSFNPHGFALRIIDTPFKYTSSPMQREIAFLISWVFVEDAWSSQTTMLLQSIPSEDYHTT